MAKERGTVEERFWRHVCAEPNSGCWLWTATLNQKGYGRFWFRERLDSAHRAAWILYRGEIPEGMELDHKCRVRSCVNPAHLEVFSHRENYVRGMGPELLVLRQLSKTHCPQGHEYTPENTYRQPNGARICRVCRDARDRERILNGSWAARKRALRRLRKATG